MLTLRNILALSCTPLRHGDDASAYAGASVTALALTLNGLAGTISSSGLAALPRLQALELRAGAIHGSIPWASMSALPLHHLDLDINALTGSIDPVVTTMVLLRELSLNRNKLTGTVPAGVTALLLLGVLDLEQNFLTGQVPAEVLTLPSIQSIVLRSNRFSGPMQSSLPGIPGFFFLQRFDASNNAITGTIPGYFKLMSIDALDLSHNDLTGTIPPQIGVQGGLSRLNLEQNRLSGSIPDSIFLQNLIFLSVQSNNLSGSLPIKWPLVLPAYFDVGNNPLLTGSLPQASDSIMYELNIVGTSMRGVATTPGGSLLPDYLVLSSLMIAVDDVLCPVVVSVSDPLFATPSVAVPPYYFAFTGCDCKSGGGFVPNFTYGADGLATSMVCVEQQPRSEKTPMWVIPVSIVIGCLVLALVAFVLVRGLMPHMLDRRSLRKKRAPPGTAAARSGQSGTCAKEVTLVLTDVEGSTELWEWDTEVTSVSIDVHDRLIRQFIAKFYGYEVMTEGDAFLIAFHEPFDAAGFCLAAQLALLNSYWPSQLLGHPAAGVNTVASLQAQQLRDVAQRIAAAGVGWHQPMPDASSCPFTSNSVIPPFVLAACIAVEPDQVVPWDHFTKMGVITRGMRVRMAVSTGIVDNVQAHTVTHRMEYHGTLSQRVQALSELPCGGQVLVDSQTFMGFNGHLNQLGAAVGFNGHLNQLGAAVVASLTPKSGKGAAASAAMRRASMHSTHASMRPSMMGNLMGSRGAGEDEFPRTGLAGAAAGAADAVRRKSVQIVRGVFGGGGSGSGVGAGGASSASSPRRPSLQLVHESMAGWGSMGGGGGGSAVPLLQRAKSSHVPVVVVQIEPAPTPSVASASYASSLFTSTATAAPRVSVRVSSSGASPPGPVAPGCATPSPSSRFGQPSAPWLLQPTISAVATAAAAATAGAAGQASPSPALPPHPAPTSSGTTVTFALGALAEGSADDDDGAGREPSSIDDASDGVAAVALTLAGSGTNRDFWHYSTEVSSASGPLVGAGGARSVTPSQAGCMDIESAMQSVGGADEKPGFRKSHSSLYDGTGFRKSISGRITGTSLAPAIMVTDGGIFRLQLGLRVEYTDVKKILMPGLEERNRLLARPSAINQLTPDYLDAPAAALAPLGQFLHVPKPDFPAVTMVFCCIQKYSDMRNASPNVARDVLDMYTATIRRSLLVMGGYECQEAEGGFMIVFTRPADALEWCLLVQEIMMEVPWTPAMLALPGAHEERDVLGNVMFIGPRVKMGVYQGVPTKVVAHSTSGRADYFGPLVNRAARFCHSAAAGGQIIASRELIEDVIEEWLGHRDFARRRMLLGERSMRREESSSGFAPPLSPPKTQLGQLAANAAADRLQQQSAATAGATRQQAPLSGATADSNGGVSTSDASGTPPALPIISSANFLAATLASRSGTPTPSTCNSVDRPSANEDPITGPTANASDARHTRHGSFADAGAASLAATATAGMEPATPAASGVDVASASSAPAAAARAVVAIRDEQLGVPPSSDSGLAPYPRRMAAFFGPNKERCPVWVMPNDYEVMKAAEEKVQAFVAMATATARRSQESLGPNLNVFAAANESGGDHFDSFGGDGGDEGPQGSDSLSSGDSFLFSLLPEDGGGGGGGLAWTGGTGTSRSRAGSGGSRSRAGSGENFHGSPRVLTRPPSRVLDSQAGDYQFGRASEQPVARGSADDGPSDGLQGFYYCGPPQLPQQHENTSGGGMQRTSGSMIRGDGSHRSSAGQQQGGAMAADAPRASGSGSFELSMSRGVSSSLKSGGLKRNSSKRPSAPSPYEASLLDAEMRRNRIRALPRRSASDLMYPSHAAVAAAAEGWQLPAASGSKRTFGKLPTPTLVATTGDLVVVHENPPTEQPQGGGGANPTDRRVSFREDDDSARLTSDTGGGVPGRPLALTNRSVSSNDVAGALHGALGPVIPQLAPRPEPVRNTPNLRPSTEFIGSNGVPVLPPTPVTTATNSRRSADGEATFSGLPLVGGGRGEDQRRAASHDDVTLAPRISRAPSVEASGGLLSALFENGPQMFFGRGNTGLSTGSSAGARNGGATGAHGSAAGGGGWSSVDQLGPLRHAGSSSFLRHGSSRLSNSSHGVEGEGTGGTGGSSPYTHSVGVGGRRTMRRAPSRLASQASSLSNPVYASQASGVSSVSSTQQAAAYAARGASGGTGSGGSQLVVTAVATLSLREQAQARQQQLIASRSPTAQQKLAGGGARHAAGGSGVPHGGLQLAMLGAAFGSEVPANAPPPTRSNPSGARPSAVQQPSLFDALCALEQGWDRSGRRGSWGVGGVGGVGRARGGSTSPRWADTDVFDGLDDAAGSLPTLPLSAILRRVAPAHWLWAREVQVRDLGMFSFKGVTGEHAVCSVTTARTASRTNALGAKHGKGKKVKAGVGDLYVVALCAVPGEDYHRGAALPGGRPV
ncbi:hypothetical protein FOA52_014716 [Chlamydomonas sp. UWO 241]|nr:hypothetical protein FOA52_014716 [Chlamydomonas sp. UWO 241]